MKSKWNEILKSAETDALYNTRILFITALELAAKNRGPDALTTAGYINPTMYMLIESIVKNTLSALMSSPHREHLSSAWCSLAEPVAVRASENAALKFVALSPVVTKKDAAISAANHFYINRHWKSAAAILGPLLSTHEEIPVDALRQLGICQYLAGNYSAAIDAFSSAIDSGDTSPETIAYITWLEEKCNSMEGCDNE